MEIPTETLINQGSITPLNVDKIKLNKDVNAKGDIRYSWELSMVGLDVEKLAKINQELLNKYG
jgi:hypothetical protein